MNLFCLILTTQINAEPDVNKLNVEIERLKEKLYAVDSRIEDLEGMSGIYSGY